MQALLTSALVASAFLLVPSAAQAQGSCPVDTTPDFTDSCYHEYVLYDVDQPEVDILILPSASPYVLRDWVIMEQSIKAWDDGINNLGPSWLASGLNLHWYSVGLEPVPDEARWDPEIVVIPAEFNPALLVGVGLQSPVYWCHGLPDPTQMAAAPGFHHHDGSPWGVLRVECHDGGFTCFVINTNSLWTPDVGNRRDMYDLNSHELGHCLGIGHVGDAFDFSAASYPRDDIMSYELDGHDAGRVLCVSTLNILALEQVYGKLLGQSGYPTDPSGTYVHQSPSAWNDDSCAEPTASSTDPAPLLQADPVGAAAAPMPGPFEGLLASLIG